MALINPDKLKNQTETSWFRSMIASWRQTRHENRFVIGVSRELLAMYRKISAEHPELNERERFKTLVMTRNNCDEIEAYDILKFAEGSYATWPVKRELTLCDVIHYLGVREFSENSDTEHWLHSNFDTRIKSIIPNVLCRIKLKQECESERRRKSSLRRI